MSGTGVVAWGVEFPDGTVALRWSSDWPTSVVFHDRGMDAVEAVHGHGGKTRVLWTDHIRAARGEIDMIRARVEVGMPSPPSAEILFGKILSAVIDKLVAANVLTRDQVETGEVEFILDAIDHLVRAAAASPMPSPPEPSPEQIGAVAREFFVLGNHMHVWDDSSYIMRANYERVARAGLVAACSVRGEK